MIPDSGLRVYVSGILDTLLKFQILDHASMIPKLWTVTEEGNKAKYTRIILQERGFELISIRLLKHTRSVRDTLQQLH
jgi:hypothetical protein